MFAFFQALRSLVRLGWLFFLGLRLFLLWWLFACHRASLYRVWLIRCFVRLIRQSIDVRSFNDNASLARRGEVRGAYGGEVYGEE